MTEASRNLYPLWDYGWLETDEVSIPRCDNIEDVISAYMRSDSFGTSFVDPQRESTSELHGPFRRSAVTHDDFQLITPIQLATELLSIRQPGSFSAPADDTQWHAVESATAALAKDSQWIVMLRLTEKHPDKFHDWGFVLGVFREFLFANPDSECLSRCIFGYD